MPYVANDFELLNLLSSSPKCWDLRCVTTMPGIFVFWDNVLCPGWPWTHYVVQVGFELVALLLQQLLESRDYKYEQLCLDFDASFPHSEHTDGAWLLSLMNSFPSWTSTPLNSYHFDDDPLRQPGLLSPWGLRTKPEPSPKSASLEQWVTWRPWLGMRTGGHGQAIFRSMDSQKSTGDTSTPYTSSALDIMVRQAHCHSGIQLLTSTMWLGD